MSKRQKLNPSPTRIYNLPKDIINREILSRLTQREVDAFASAASISKKLEKMTEKDILKRLLQEKTDQLVKEINSFDDAVDSMVQIDQFVQDKLRGVYPDLNILNQHHLPFLWRAMKLKKGIHDWESAVEQIKKFIQMYFEEFFNHTYEVYEDPENSTTFESPFTYFDFYWDENIPEYVENIYDDDDERFFDREQFLDEAIQDNRSLSLIIPNITLEETIQKQDVSKVDINLLSLIYKLGFYKKLNFMSGLVLRVPMI
jgi:hypothetical protein